MPDGSTGSRAGEWPIGAGPVADAVVSVATSGAVTALDLRTGAVVGPVGGRLELSVGAALVSPAGSVTRRRLPTAPGWTEPVVRSPRQPDPRPPAPEPPAPLDVPPRPGSPSLVPVVVSLVGGIVLAVALQQVLVLMLGALGAVGTLVTFAWQRWRWRRRLDRGRRAHDAAWAEHQGAVVDHATELAAWSWRRHPDLTVVVDRAAGWTDGLWATRVRTGDALEVAIGEEWADGIPTPAIVTLEPGHALGVVGPRGRGRGRGERHRGPPRR